MTLNEEKALRNYISHIVRESLEEFNSNEFMPSNNYDMFERGLKHKHLKHHHKKESEGEKIEKRDNKAEKASASKNKRKSVISWLKNNATDCAEIMRRLWNPKPEDEDAQRSYFYKCRDGKLNDSGVPYKFSDEDINALYKLQSEDN